MSHVSDMDIMYMCECMPLWVGVHHNLLLAGWALYFIFVPYSYCMLVITVIYVPAVR